MTPLDPLAAFFFGCLLGMMIAALVQASIYAYVQHATRGETPWLVSAMDADVEVRWKDGHIESRLRPRQP